MTNQAKRSDRADGIKPDSPTRRCKRGSMHERHHLSHAQIQIARGLAMNPKRRYARSTGTKAILEASLPYFPEISGSKYPEPIATRPFHSRVQC